MSHVRVTATATATARSENDMLLDGGDEADDHSIRDRPSVIQSLGHWLNRIGTNPFGYINYHRVDTDTNAKPRWHDESLMIDADPAVSDDNDRKRFFCMFYDPKTLQPRGMVSPYAIDRILVETALNAHIMISFDVLAQASIQSEQTIYGRQFSNVDSQYCIYYPSGRKLYVPSKPDPFSTDIDDVRPDVVAQLYLYWKLSVNDQEIVFAVDRTRLITSIYAPCIFSRYFFEYIAACVSSGMFGEWATAVRTHCAAEQIAVPQAFKEDYTGDVSALVQQLYLNDAAFLYMVNHILPFSAELLGSRTKPFSIDTDMTELRYVCIMLFVFEINWGVCLQQTQTPGSAFGTCDVLAECLCCLKGRIAKFREIERIGAGMFAGVIATETEVLGLRRIDPKSAVISNRGGRYHVHQRHAMHRVDTNLIRLWKMS